MTRTLTPTSLGHRYTPQTLDLSGWWRAVFDFGTWLGAPVDADNHPTAEDQFLIPPATWQQTVFINLGFWDEHSYVSDFGGASDRMWENVADPGRGGDGLNGYLLQISDQRRVPGPAGVREAAGAWRATAFVPLTGIGLIMQLLGNTETQSDGDANLLIAYAPNPPALLRPPHARPQFTGTWLDIKANAGGTFRMDPLDRPPAFPSPRA